MLREVVVFAMFKDENAVRLQQLFLEDEVWNLGQLLQCIGWVGKDKVVLLLTTLDEAEDITANGKYFGGCPLVIRTPLSIWRGVVGEAVDAFSNEAVVVAV